MVYDALAMQSTRNPAKATYAIGVTHNGSIYLTPVDNLIKIDGIGKINIGYASWYFIL